MADLDICNRRTWEDGSNKMTRGQFQTETKLLEKEIGDLLVAKAGMRASTYKLAGMKSSDDSKQSRWRQAVLKAYGENNNKAWCPISKLWFPSSCITAAHIVRHNVTELAAEHLFGPAKDSSGHIWSTKNGIPLMSAYEKILDDAVIAIIPTADGKDLKVVVLDHTLLEHKAVKGESALRQLNGQVLEFQTEHRPSMRYLYFSFAVNILRRQRYAVDGWWKDRIHCTEVPFFATPGKWVKETTLRKLAVRVGHLPITEAKEFVDVIQGQKTEGPSKTGEGGDNGEDRDLYLRLKAGTYQSVSCQELFIDPLKQPSFDTLTFDWF
ncbi:hypothetical protein F5Y07DRAFT_411255 [Xylaria sp. FL0933]|nr:hypothetical protein F5Y07DRAFT_411255 [Xylaria sp. FL0933]